MFNAILLELDGAAAFENVLGFTFATRVKIRPFVVVCDTTSCQYDRLPAFDEGVRYAVEERDGNTPDKSTNHLVGPLYKAYVCYG